MENKIITSMNVQDREVRVMRVGNEEYISLTDIARYKNLIKPSDVISKWMSSYATVEFLGLWETLNNDDFNCADFDAIKKETPKNHLLLYH